MSARDASAVTNEVQRPWLRLCANDEMTLRANWPTGLRAASQPYPSSVHGDRSDNFMNDTRRLRDAEAKQGATSAQLDTRVTSQPKGSADKTCELVTERRDGATDKPVGASQAGAVTFMSPIFHFTAHDITITAMEHNNHCKLLALATSRNEIYITQTLVMPVMESLGVTSADLDPLNSLGAPSSPPPRAPPIDVRLLDWSPAEMTTLVDRLGSPCVQLQWAPWQHGVYLAALCPGRHIRLYRYSHDRWALDAVMPCPDCLHFAFSTHFTIACACGGGGGGIRLLASSVAQTQDGHAWIVCSTLGGGPGATPPTTSRGEAVMGGQRQTNLQSDLHEAYGHGTASEATAGTFSSPHVTVHGDDADGDKRSPLLTRRTGYEVERAGCLCVAWDDSGSVLAVGRQDGRVDVFWVSERGRKLGPVAFSLAPGSSAVPSPTRRGGRCSQVAWSPSSGRSFLALAVAHASRLSLMLFARPRQLSLVGLPQLAAATGRQEMGGAAGAQPGMLRLLASTTMVCKGIVRLTWNTTGTRFVTSHVDNTVHVWSMCVRHAAETSATPSAAASAIAAGNATVMTTAGGAANCGVDFANIPVTRPGEARVATTSLTSSAVIGELATTSLTAWRMSADGTSNAAVLSGPGVGAGDGRATRGFTLSVSVKEVTSVHPYHAVNGR